MSGLARTLTPFDPAVPFSALKAVRTPRPTRWTARLLVTAFVLSPVALVFVPWQQTVNGRGTVIAYAPTERKQVVTARVSGQVGKWYVVEQQRVKAGDKIVDIEDNDPELAKRLANQKRNLQDRLAAFDQQVAELKGVVAAQTKAREAQVSAAQATRDAAGKAVAVARQVNRTTTLNRDFLDQTSRLLTQLLNNPGGGLVPGLQELEARVRAAQAKEDVLRTEAEIDRVTAAEKTAAAQVDQADATGRSNIATANSSLQSAEQGRQASLRELELIDTQIQRFEARFVVAPVSGVVQSVMANAGVGGALVKEGDELATIVPDTTERVVELLIDGLDAPLVAAHMEATGRGPHVRVQFEGWPAVQFAGWPSVAIGTFGGRVRQMDPGDDGNGRFRVLIEPEAMFEGDTWPEGIYLRQGNQALGWVFLNRVTLGYELWRQFNGFPPVIAPKAPEKAKDDKGGKPPKIKV
jgi:multidrug efflux pump subunit AcrA (membrane-fusion protein)